MLALNSLASSVMATNPGGPFPLPNPEELVALVGDGVNPMTQELLVKLNEFFQN